MKRTGISIAGAICLLFASLFTGLGGVGMTFVGHADKLMDYANKAAEAEGKMTPEQKRQLEESSKQVNEALKDPEKRQQMESMKNYGYFELLAALVGLVGGVGLLLANGFGKAAGIAGAALGLLACVWGVVVMGLGGIVVQGLFLVMYVVALMGALSLKSQTTR